MPRDSTRLYSIQSCSLALKNVVQFYPDAAPMVNFRKMPVQTSHKRNSTKLLFLSLLSAPLWLLNGCQIDLVDQARQTTANVATGIANLPSSVLPAVFESTAYIDGDYSIPRAAIEADGEYAVVRTFFSTNRSFTLEAEPTCIPSEHMGPISLNS